MKNKTTVMIKRNPYLKFKTVFKTTLQEKNMFDIFFE